VRPDRYVEISNFYTPTVYEKGAEVVRMMHTLVGREGFRRGTIATQMMGAWLAGHDFDWPTVKLAVLEFAAAHDLPVLEVSARSWQIRKPGALTWTVPPQARKALVAVCSNERTIFRQTADSLVRLGWGGRLLKAMRAADFVDIQFTWVHQSPRVDALRDQALLLAKTAGGNRATSWDPSVTTGVRLPRLELDDIKQ
jgi:hypothetical protein